MIEENKDLYRSFEIYKAFAVYNMVIIHGLAMLIGLFPTEEYHELGHDGLRFLRSAFSMTLPIFAGFYLRHFLGPFIEKYKLRASLSSIALQVVYMAFVIEALRQFLMRWDLRHSFSWHSLHFCALSFIVSIFLAKKDTRLIGVLSLLLLGIRFVIPDPTFSGLAPSGIGLQILAILWGVSFGILAWGWALPRKGMKKFWKIAPFFALSLLGYFLIRNDNQELKNFYHLPLSMLFLVQGDGNYWPLFIFFPFFASGYFFRSILFDIRQKHLFLPLLILAGLGVLISYLNLPDLSQELARGATIRREAFSMPSVHVIGIISFFYLCWSVTYLVFRKGRFLWIDSWVKWTGSVVLVYVVHTAIYALTVRLLFRIDYPKSSLILLYSLLHIVYVISLVICYHLQKLIPRILGLLR